METLSVVADSNGTGPLIYRATANGREGVGSTIGQAIDSLPADASGDSSMMMVLVQSFRPDRFFTAEQQARLNELMDKSRSTTETMSAEEEAELEELIKNELRGATQRSAAVLGQLNP